jgi:sugar phosphate isomerase/epimerase
MKLGIAGFLPGNWRQIDLQATQRVRQTGFHGAQLFIDRPLEASQQELAKVKQAFLDANLEICQANGWYEALVNPDDRVRAEGVRGVQALCRIGQFVGAASVYVRPGGLNPNGHWYAHPDNHTPETFDHLVGSLKLACRVAENEGVLLAVEGHVLSPLDTPQRVRDLIDAVQSPVLKFNIDPVNFIGTVKQVHNTRPVLDELFDLLGKESIAAHAKDVVLMDALVVHIQEVIPGTGTLDYPHFMRRFNELQPDGYFLIEHLPDPQVLIAREYITKTAAQYGIHLEV